MRLLSVMQDSCVYLVQTQFACLIKMARTCWFPTCRAQKVWGARIVSASPLIGDSSTNLQIKVIDAVTDQRTEAFSVDEWDAPMVRSAGCSRQFRSGYRVYNLKGGARGTKQAAGAMCLTMCEAPTASCRGGQHVACSLNSRCSCQLLSSTPHHHVPVRPDSIAQPELTT